MAKFNLIVADPPWSFSDRLKMSDVKRGAASQYKTMTDKQILGMPVQDIVAKDALMALWVPSSKLQLGMDCLKAWGFVQKQTWVWCKVQNNPLIKLTKRIKKEKKHAKSIDIKDACAYINDFDINESLSFGMGRIGRNVHELILIGVKGNIYKKIKNKSQRTVFFAPIGKHSAKPTILHEKLEVIFPKSKKLELFARNTRKGWVTVGLECPNSGEDVYSFLKK